MKKRNFNVKEIFFNIGGSMEKQKEAKLLL